MIEQHRDPDDEFVDLLAACDEQLATGAAFAETHSSAVREAHDQLADRLENAKKCLISLEQAWPRSNKTEFLLPESIGRFRILRQLGRGGFGTVFLADDSQLSRQVALKVPHAIWVLSRDGQQRFLREAEAAARLNHAHILTVYEVGQAGAVPFIASEYCAGPSLAEWLAQRKTMVPVREAADLVEKLAGAMHHAHARGVLHRDLKPSNVLLTIDSPRESSKSAGALSSFSPKILDFGLAKVLTSDGDQTRTGAVLGTLAYLAPEQADGRVHDVSVQTDIYALGVILYELLTGTPPNRGKTEAETLQKVLLGELSAPRRFRPDIPGDLEAICLKCLERSSAMRYATAGALAEDLGRFRDGRPTLASPVSLTRRTWRWTKRRPTLAGLIGVAIVALVTVISGAFIYNSKLNLAFERIARESAVNRELLYSSNVRLASDAWQAGSLVDAVDVLAAIVPGDGQSDPREFTWHYLWNLAHSERLTLRGHQGDVYQVAFSPNGQLLATGGMDGTARLWDAATGSLVRVFHSHQNEVNAVIFAHEGSLVTASDDGKVMIWDVATGQCVRSLEANDGEVFGLAICSERRLLASGGSSGEIHFWDFDSGSLLWSTPKSGIVESLSFSPDGRILVSGHRNGSTRWWNIDQRSLIQDERAFDDWAVSVAYSPHLPQVVVAGRTGMLRTYRRYSSDRWRAGANVQIDSRAMGIYALAISPRDNTFATGSRDGAIRLWNVGGRLSDIGHLPGHGERVWSVAWSPDGCRLASASADGTVKVWNVLQSASRRTAYPRLSSPICSLAVSADGQSILTGNIDGRVHEWDRRTRQVRRVSDDRSVGFTGGCYVGEEESVIVAGPKGGLRAMNLRSGEVTSLSPIESALPCSMAMSGDGNLLAVGYEHGHAALFDVRTGTLQRRFTACVLDVRCVALSRDGQRLATAGVGAEIELWDTRTGERQHILPGHDGRVLSLTFATDGKSLFSGGTDHNIRRWEVSSGQLIATLVGQPAAVTALAVSPDGRTLASGSHEPALIRTWDLRTHGQLKSFRGVPGDVYAVSFAPDGRSLIAGCGTSDAGQLVEWKLDRFDHNSTTEAVITRQALRPLEVDATLETEKEIPGSQISSPGCVELFQAVNEYAHRAGFETGYPTFRTTADGGPSQVEAVLLRGPGTKKIYVGLDDFHDSDLIPRADYKTQDDLLRGVQTSVDRWARGKGYQGALPAYYLGTNLNATLALEVELLFGSRYSRVKLDQTELGEVKDGGQLFQQVHSWAVKAGFLSAFPTFNRSGNRLECVVVRPGTAEVVQIPIGELVLKAPARMDR